MSAHSEPRRPPRAPWGSFPLSELTVLVAVGAAIYGVVSLGTRPSAWAFAAAASLGSLVGLEVALREHFAGYRPHTTVLATTAGVAVMTVAVLLVGDLVVGIAAGGAVFVAAAMWLRRSYDRQ